MSEGKTIDITADRAGFLRVRDKIIKLLEDENCTVRQADYILTQTSRGIHATAPVQFIEETDYEF